MVSDIVKNSSNQGLGGKLGKKYLNKQFSEEILNSVDQSKIEEIGDVIVKVHKANRVIKNIIKPIESIIGEIDKISRFVSVVNTNYEGAKKGTAHSQQELSSLIKDLFGDEPRHNIIDKLPETLDTPGMIGLLEIFFTSNTDGKKDSLEVVDILRDNKDALTLHYTTTSNEFGENPSIIDFLGCIKDEMMEYRDKVSSISIEKDLDVIHKVELQEWLKEQKKNGYIKLPYYDNVLKDIRKLDRPGKVGKVILKGHPGTGKTSVFSYKGAIENRPYRIISMHQYINFYELIVQNTNLSPTKNQLDFFSSVIEDYSSVSDDDVVNRLQELFDVNKGAFPSNFTLVDFINSIFDVNRFVKGDKEAENKLQVEDLQNKKKIKDYVIKMLNYWKDEKIYKLLLSKKELVKGEILDAIEKGENVVLDEIDKVQEKELEGLLAFLDQNTGKHYKIQGIDEKIFIPEWFGVYGTSNDKHKPSGPLGRRFNTLELDYLDEENLTRYILVKIINVNLTTPFSEQEIDQIQKAIEIIIKTQDDDNYSALDFSVRMIDTFINNFTAISNNIVGRKVGTDPKTYILRALSDAFEAQTEDIYNAQTKMSEVTDQKEMIQSEIQKSMEAESYIVLGKRLNTTNEGKVSLYIKNLGYKNELVNSIVLLQRQDTEEHTKKMLDYPVQMGEILTHFDKKLQKLQRVSSKSKKSFIMNAVSELHINNEFMSIDYDLANKKLTIVSQKGRTDQRTDVLVGENVYANPDKDAFIVTSSVIGDKYITIERGMVKIDELSNTLQKLNSNYDSEYAGKTPERFFFINDQLFWINSTKHDDKEANASTLNYLFSDDGDTLGIPSSESFDIYDDGLLAVSYNDKKVAIIGLNTEIDNTQFPYKEDLENMETYINISIDDLGFSDGKITDVNFDATMHYMLITIQINNKTEILPITL